MVFPDAGILVVLRDNFWLKDILLNSFQKEWSLRVRNYKTRK